MYSKNKLEKKENIDKEAKKTSSKSKQKQKKGFTLIELLAVIIILGILMIIAIPSVTKYINDSRKSSYVNTAKEIIAGAKNLVNEGKLGMYDTETTYYIPVSCIRTENGAKSPYGEFTNGKTYVVVTYDGKGYDYYWLSLDETGQGIKTPVAYDELDEDDIMSDIKMDDVVVQTVNNTKYIEIFNESCSTSDKPEMAPNGTVMPVQDCTYNGELIQGAEYVNGQYTYRYMQRGIPVNTQTGVVIGRDWTNMDVDGWGVILTDGNTTEPVTSKLCTKINNKPIVAMSAMFAAAKTNSIDFSSFDTSNVYTMSLMFAYATNLKSVNLSNFNTSSLQAFGNTFLGCSSLIDVNLDNFDWRNSNSVGAVFIGADSLKTLSMRNWKLNSNFNNFLYRAWSVSDSSIETVDVTNWDLGNLESLAGFFGGHGRATSLKNIIGLNTWNTSNIKDMGELFSFNSNLTSLDLSSWDLSNVNNTSIMFMWCDKVTNAYARTQEDANKLNSSSQKPTTMTFIVK